jgi:purine catabolism regulator
MEVPDILNWVRPGQLLVTTLFPLRDNHAALESLVPSLAEKGLAGLALSPGAFFEDFPPCMLEAAEALDFPLIELPPNVSFIDVIQPLTSKILNLQAEELRQSGQILHQFIELVLNGGSYSDIANIIAQVTQCPVSIVDRFRRVLGSGTALGRPTIDREFIHREKSDDAYLSDAYQPEVIERIPDSGVQYVGVTRPDGTQLTCATCSIDVSRMVLGKIILWEPPSCPLPLTHMMAIEHGSTVVALKMMEARSMQEVEQRFRNEILEVLLSRQPQAHERLVYLSHGLSSQLRPPFVVVIVRPDVSPTKTLPAERIAEQSNIDSSLYLARRYIARLAPDASLWHYGPRLVVFLPVQSAGKNLGLTEQLQKISDRIASENSPYTISMGISSITEEIDLFRDAFDGANQSLNLGSVFQGQTSVVTRYDDLGLLRIVAADDSAARLQRFCDDTIGKLIRYDQEHDTELVLTLRVLLEKQSVALAAKALNIHYNTLRYRLERIKEVLGDVLDNPQQRLAIEVALQFHRVANRSSLMVNDNW